MASEPKTNNELLQNINTNVSALLAITLDDYVRTHRIEGAKEVPIERMLINAGLSQNEVATLLGKTRQAVGQQLRKPAKKKAAKKKA